MLKLLAVSELKIAVVVAIVAVNAVIVLVTVVVVDALAQIGSRYQSSPKKHHTAVKDIPYTRKQTTHQTTPTTAKVSDRCYCHSQYHNKYSTYNISPIFPMF